MTTTQAVPTSQQVPPPVIEAIDVHRRFRGGFEAVRGVSFAVRRGELFALLGTNGAGKTSTVELLEGLAAPARGRVRVLGRDPIGQRRWVRRRTGMMLQEAGFPAGLTVDETARLWAGTLSAARPVGEVLELVGLSHRRPTRVTQLSGGERRRLDLALAVLGRPEVLFLDEPTAGLDPESRRHTWDVIGDLLAAGNTVLLTTHDLGEAATLADRLAIMHAGRIVRTGSPAELAAGQARIAFRLDPGIPPPVAPPGATVTAEGRQTVVYTSDPQRTLAELLAWAGAGSVRLDGLETRAGSLEETFLAIAATPAEVA